MIVIIANNVEHLFLLMVTSIYMLDVKSAITVTFKMIFVDFLAEASLFTI